MIDWFDILLTYIAGVGWLTAFYQYARAEQWKEKYHELKTQKMDALKQSIAAGAGAAVVEKAANAFGLISEGDR